MALLHQSALQWASQGAGGLPHKLAMSVQTALGASRTAVQDAGPRHNKQDRAYSPCH